MTDELVQGTLEWRMARVGFATASRVCDIVKTNQNGKPSSKRAKYLDELVGERLTGKPQDWKEVASLEARKAQEGDARAGYAFLTGLPVVEVGFIKHPVIEWAGCSPDGLVQKSGGIEIKALDAANHFKLFDGRADEILDEYLPQVRFNLACCAGRKWWDFVAFHAAAPPEMKLYIKRIERKEHELAISLLESAVKDFLAEVDERVKRIRVGT